MKSTLCWKCARPCMPDSCDWIRVEKPIDGWTAIPTTLETSYNPENQTSYLVLKCPLFMPGRKYLKTKHRPKPLPDGFLTLDGLQKRWKCAARYIKECIEQGMPHEKDDYQYKFDIARVERWMRTSG